MRKLFILNIFYYPTFASLLRKQTAIIDKMSKKLLAQLKMYNIKQNQICKATGLSTSMVCRFFGGTKQQDPINTKIITMCANRLISEAKAAVAKLGQK